MSLSSAWKWRAVTLGQKENTWKVISKVFCSFRCLHYVVSTATMRTRRERMFCWFLCRNISRDRRLDKDTARTSLYLLPRKYSTHGIRDSKTRLFFFQPVRAISLGFQWTWVYLRGTYVDPRRALLHGLGLNSRRASKGSPGEA